MDEQNPSTEYQTGDEAPRGMYICATCANDTHGHRDTVTIDSETTVLPKCPWCGHTTWYQF